MAMTNFRAIDMLGAQKHPNEEAAPQATQADGNDAPVAETVEEVVADDEDDKVPSGSSAEVLAWVGGDKGRAQKALDVEQADSSPRKGLSADLKEIIAK